MPATAFLDDPFQSVLAGSGVPPGWSLPGGGSVTVNAFGTPAGGAAPPHNWASVRSNGFASPIAPGGVWASGLSLNWFSRITGATDLGFFARAFATDAFSNQIALALIIQEADGTISVKVGPGSPSGSSGNLVCNTGSVGVSLPTGGVWFYLQINLVLGMSGGFAQLQADIIIDGTLVVSGTKASSLYAPTDFPNYDFNQVDFRGGGASPTQDIADPFVLQYSATPIKPDGIWTVDVTNGGTLYNPATTTVTFTGGTPTLNGTAVPVITPITGVITKILFTPGSGFTSAPAVVIVDTGVGSGATATTTLEPVSFMRIPQTPIEIATEPDNANIRISQAPMEIATLPVTAHIRISQMVIELATPFVRKRGRVEYIKRRP